MEYISFSASHFSSKVIWGNFIFIPIEPNSILAEISEKISYFLNTIVEILCRGSEGLTSMRRDAVHFGCSWKPSQSCTRVTVRFYQMCCRRAVCSLCWETCAPESWWAFKEIMGKAKRIRRWIEWRRYYCKWGNVLLTAMLITGDSEEMF